MSIVNQNAILSIIAKHHSFEPIAGYQVKLDNIMYTYGSSDEFKEIISEIEETFGVILIPPPGEDIGEMTVKKFIDRILEAMEDDDDEEIYSDSTQ